MPVDGVVACHSVGGRVSENDAGAVTPSAHLDSMRTFPLGKRHEDQGHEFRRPADVRQEQDDSCQATARDMQNPIHRHIRQPTRWRCYSDIVECSPSFVGEPSTTVLLSSGLGQVQ